MANPRIIAVANHKGGAAKTTTAVNLAAALALRGEPTLLVDLDPQGNASSWLGGDWSAGRSMFEPGATVRELARNTPAAGLAIIPASPSLADAERALSEGGAATSALSRALSPRACGSWRNIVLDTPPAQGLLTSNAIAAADTVLVPVEAHVMALMGVVQILGTIRAVQREIKPSLSLLGFVICRFNTRNRHCAEVRERLVQRFPREVLRTTIRENVRLAEAPSFGLPITDYAPSSSGAADYRDLAAEIAMILEARTT